MESSWCDRIFLFKCILCKNRTYPAYYNQPGSVVDYIHVLLFENFQNKVKRIVYGFLTITLYVLIMYTSWYTAFFTALFMATFIVIYVCVASSNKNKVFSNVWMYIKKCYKEIIAYVVYAICIAIPFSRCIYR